MRDCTSQRTTTQAASTVHHRVEAGDCELQGRSDRRRGSGLSWWQVAAGAAVLLLGTAGRGVGATQPSQGARAETTYADTVFEHLTERDGLAAPVVEAFAEDGDGFLWVGTQEGMSRWDGYHFRNYQAVLGVTGALPDNLVQVLYGDPQGRLWIGTSAGLALYDRNRDQFTTFPTKPEDVSRAGIWAIETDGAHGLWVGTPAGLTHFDIAGGRFDGFHPRGETGALLAAAPVHAVLRDTSGVLWIGSNKGLFRSDAKERNFVAVAMPLWEGLPPSVQSLCRDQDGHLWIGTTHGVFLMSGSTEMVREVIESRQEAVSGERTSLQDEQVTKIVEAQPGVVWLGTSAHGIVAVDTKTLQTHRIPHDMAISSSLADDGVETLYRDHEGTVWVGMRHGGVSRTDPAYSGVLTFYGGSSRVGRLADADVFSVLAEPKGPIWLGLGKQGVDLFDWRGLRVGALRPDPLHPKTALPKGRVQGLTNGPPGTVFIGSDQGLYRADTDGHHLRRIAYEGKLDPNVTAMVYDRDVLWVGGRNGLWRLDPRESDGGTLRRAEPQGALTDDRITSMSEGPSGRDLWVGTENGLNRVDERTMEVERIQRDPTNPKALATGFISSVLLDPKKRLWISTFGGGINLLEGEDSAGRPQFHRVIDGLPNANIDVLLDGPDGNIWASTDGGIAILNPDTFGIKVLQQPEGIAIADYWINSGAASQQNGTLLFGGLGGLTVIQPARFQSWHYIPPVVVTDARIGGREVPVSVFNDPQAREPVTIAPDENSLMVEFSSLDYTEPKRNHYEYRLEGFDRGWISTDQTRRLASYTNLPPGNYRLELRGSNRTGEWATIRTVKIRVLPAWYQTIWSRIGFTVAGLLLLAGGFLAGTAYLRARQRALKRQVALRTEELENLTTELRLSQQKLEQLAYSDTLTGLPNRRMFNDCFRRLLALKHRQHGIFALLIIDLDAFKQVNDTHGHDAGDAVLMEVARRLERMVRASDCFARVGGDEFFMLLAEPTEMLAVEYVCCRMIECFAEPVQFRGLSLRVTVSIGAALYPGDGETQDSLYKSADLALYRVKRNGGNGWRMQEAELETRGHTTPLESAD
jgi:diguanylate cyclase (GGDEF)-like protein